MRGYVKWKVGTDLHKHFDSVQKIVQQELGKWSECKLLLQAHDALGAASAEERCVLFGRAIMESLKKCGCVTDPKTLLDAFHMSLQPFDQMGIWTAKLDRRAGLDLTGQPAARWRDVVGRIVAGNENAGFFLKVTPDESSAGLRWRTPPGGRVFRSHRMRVFVGTATINGRVDKQPVRRVVKRHLYELKACYRDVGLAANRKLKGEVRVKFVISSSGHVGSVEFVESTLNHKPMEACVKKAFKGWVFPGPDEGSATVVLKMAFRPPGW
jgi:TonB family protein